jgi:PAS domain S-box-containing protein
MQTPETDGPRPSDGAGTLDGPGAIIQLDRQGTVTALSGPAAALLGDVAGRPATELLFATDGQPLSPRLFTALASREELAPLRQGGLTLQARTTDGTTRAVGVWLQTGDDDAIRLRLRGVPDPEATAGTPTRAMLAACRARAALLRRPAATDEILRGFCQALMDAGYPGAVVHLAEPGVTTEVRPVAWARQGVTEVAQAPDAMALAEDSGMAEALRSGQPASDRCLPRWLAGWVAEAGPPQPAACLILPLGAAGQGGTGVVGLFGEDPATFDAAEAELLAELARDLGRALAGGPAQPQDAAGDGELSGILEAAPDCLAALDRQGRLRYLNSGGLNLLGRPEEAAWHQQPLTDFQPEAAARRFLDEALPAALAQGSWRGETTLRSAHGTEIPVDQTLVAQPGADGRVHTLFTIIRDISDRKREEARLRDSEEKYRRILEAAQEGFWIVHDQLQGDERPQLRFKVPVSKGSRIVLVDLPEVRYFQADGHYTQVYTGDGHCLCNLSVSDLERRLDTTQFVRIHRSYIVNLQHTQVLERMDDQWCVTVGDDADGERLPVSRRNVEKVKVMLGVS